MLSSLHIDPMVIGLGSTLSPIFTYSGKSRWLFVIPVIGITKCGGMEKSEAFSVEEFTFRC